MNKKGLIWVLSIVVIFALVAVYAIFRNTENDSSDDLLHSNEEQELTNDTLHMGDITQTDPEPEDDIDQNTQEEINEEPEPELSYNDPVPDLNHRLPNFEPYAVETTEPDLMLHSSAAKVNGEIMDSYTFEDQIDFGLGMSYSLVDGITTFRGNNFRDDATFGRANIQNARLSEIWTARSGSLTTPAGSVWTGHGWTGQPLIIRWPYETRQIMNMFDWAKEKEDLVEVIYPAMDGMIYFFELETGQATRSRYNIGYPFKGCGSIDPRGYPLLYVGAGDHSTLGRARIFIISLIDGSILHSFGAGDPFAQRDWPMADAAPLIDIETDKLIYAGENGILYIINLKSNFDPAAGTISIDPETYRWRFRGKRSNVNSMYWLGFEASPAMWRGHIFLADNGGHLICLNINTLEIVWILDNLDDTNCSPVIAIEDGKPYIYISMAFHGNGWRAPADSRAPVPIRKIDATTGRIIWETDHYSYTEKAVAGGVQGTIALGKNQLRDMIFVSIAKYPNRGGGALVAIDKSTGETVWEYQTATHGWGSPVVIYDEDGRGYIIHTELGKNMFLLDGMTGAVLDRIDLRGHIEASPAVFENIIVIGTRWQDIFGIKIS